MKPRPPIRLWHRGDVLGTPLKGSAETSILDLTTGASNDWLGYAISLADGKPAIRIAQKAWHRLAMSLSDAHWAGFTDPGGAEISAGMAGLSRDVTNLKTGHRWQAHSKHRRRAGHSTRFLGRLSYWTFGRRHINDGGRCGRMQPLYSRTDFLSFGKCR